MKLVIEILEEDYNNIEPFLSGQTIKGGFNLFKVLEIIKNGKPLPKGHGRIVDENKITSFGWNNTDNHAVVDAPTIIEADKESAE